MICIIAALTKNFVIGKNNKLLYKIPEDFKRMQKLTTGHPIIMGRKTHESIGKPLPKRTNIVVTRKKDYRKTGIITASNLKNAIEIAKKHSGAERIFIFGGASIYKESLEKNLVDKMYLTIIDEKIEGDAYFPKFDKKKWQAISEQKRIVKLTNQILKYFFQTYKKL